MTTTQELVDEIFDAVRPSDLVEVSVPQVLGFVNRAARVARSSGWLLHMEDDESLTFLANTWEYAVPATFAYVRSLRVEEDSTSPSTWDEYVPYPFWEMRINDSNPYFYIVRDWPIPIGQGIKVIGQKRPSQYTAVTDTIDPGMEAFLTERATQYVNSFMSAGNPTLDLDRSRMDLARMSYGVSEQLLGRHPQEFRVLPNSRLVPGR